MKAQLADFYGNFCTEEETKDAIREVYKASDYVIDTHTAVAAGVYKKYVADTKDDVPAVIASTASPYNLQEALWMLFQRDMRIWMTSDLQTPWRSSLA